MSDNVNIIVQDTINEIVVNTAVIVETIDINVQSPIDEVTIITNPNNYIVNINRVIGQQVQSDWNQNDNQEPDYIKNKPIIPTEQVNSDWNATSGKAEILNKPTIPSISNLIPYTGANSDVELGPNNLFVGGRNEIILSPTGLEVYDTYPAASTGAIITSTNVNVYDYSVSSYVSISSNGILFPDLSFQDKAFPPTGGTSSQYIKGDGTLATFPSITNLVPYTGANSDVDLGTNDLYSNKLWLYDAVNNNHGSIHFTDTDFHIEDADGHKMLVIEDGFMQIHLSDTIQSNLYTSNLTQTRDHYLPNQSGTIALTSDITGINSGINTGDETIATIKTKLGITTLSGSNTGDQDLSGLVVKNTAIIGATKTKITYDSKGLVTAGSDATTADIADSTNKRYQTDNQKLYNDATSSIQTQLNAKQNTLGFTPYRYINTSSSSVTGTTTETIMATATIAANTFNANDIMKILYEVNKTTILVAPTLRIRINTTNTISGSTTIATYTMPAANTFALMQRNFVLSSSNLVGFSFTTTSLTDITTAVLSSTSTAYNTANTLYLFFTIQLANTGDIAFFTMGNITN
jgi:hypothetical protein